MRWSEHSLDNCIAQPLVGVFFAMIDSLKLHISDKISVEYRKFLEVFSKTDTTTLPPHRPYDSSIYLLLSTVPPHSHVYLLSVTEQ